MLPRHFSPVAIASSIPRCCVPILNRYANRSGKESSMRESHYRRLLPKSFIRVIGFVVDRYPQHEYCYKYHEGQYPTYTACE